MIHSPKLCCVLDTNVIYPLWIRDLLLWFAHYDLYTPRWSKHIFDEWLVVMRRKGISDVEAAKRTHIMNDAFPDALVIGYESLIPVLKLADQKDKHVLAAAVKANANLIITNNLKDFPAEYLSTFGLRAKCPDVFLAEIINNDNKTSIIAFNELVSIKKNPVYEAYQVLEILRKYGLRETTDLLRSLL